MQLSAVWLVPLGVGVAGAVALTFVAAGLRREVDRLQRAMRPLRTERRRIRRID